VDSQAKVGKIWYGIRLTCPVTRWKRRYASLTGMDLSHVVLRLPDRPGSLGIVTTLMGRLGVDIHELVVTVRDGDWAIDEFLVAIPGPVVHRRLADLLEEIVGVSVLGVRPCAGLVTTPSGGVAGSATDAGRSVAGTAGSTPGTPGTRAGTPMPVTGGTDRTTSRATDLATAAAGMTARPRAGHGVRCADHRAAVSSTET